jgi:hypothetical protein
MLAVKFVMIFSGMKRGPRHVAIMWHFLPLAVAYPCMYLTTVMSGETAAFISSVTGYDITWKEVFSMHCKY